MSTTPEPVPAPPHVLPEFRELHEVYCRAVEVVERMGVLGATDDNLRKNSEWGTVQHMHGTLASWAASIMLRLLKVREYYPALFEAWKKASALPDVRPPDEIEMKAGIVHLPDEFRQVARAANAAGLAGFEVADVEYGMDTAAARQLLDKCEPSMGEEIPRIPVRIKLSYRRPA
jgi:hypothetical protein